MELTPLTIRKLRAAVIHLGGKLRRTALVDVDDWQEVNRYSWCCTHGYAVRSVRRNGRKSTQRMHRLLLGLGRGKDDQSDSVDHANGNTLDNRRCNLRIATVRLNQRNRRKHKPQTSRYKGVSYLRQPGPNRWRARIRLGDGSETHVGVYPTEDEAALAYNRAALRYFGEFACLNPIAA